MTDKEFEEGWSHFCKCVNFDHSALDAEAIRFMNEMPAKAKAALLRDASATVPGLCVGCGCTEAQACPGGCYWVAPDLCCKCAREFCHLIKKDGN